LIGRDHQNECRYGVFQGARAPPQRESQPEGRSLKTQQRTTALQSNDVMSRSTWDLGESRTLDGRNPSTGRTPPE